MLINCFLCTFSEANYRNGKYTKEKLQQRKNVTHVSKRIVAELKSIEQPLINEVLYDPTDYG